MERVCNKTEFEVEGWRKIPPLMEKLEQNVPTHVQQSMKLEMIPNKPVFEKNVSDEAFIARDSSKLSLRDSSGPGKTIRDSWIYEHFSNKDKKQSKIALYVTEIIPINQNLDVSKINSVGNRCVIARGLAKWPKNDPNGIECLELEIFGDSDEMRYIPVEFPFFEEIRIDINKIYQRSELDVGSELRHRYYNRAMNKLGEKLALTKWKTIEDNWYHLKKKPKGGQEEAEKENQRWKYGMIFVRGIHPCFQLKFTY